MFISTRAPFPPPCDVMGGWGHPPLMSRGVLPLVCDDLLGRARHLANAAPRDLSLVSSVAIGEPSPPLTPPSQGEERMCSAWRGW